MTFIIAIQLNDSIIITADKRKVVLKEEGEVHFDTGEISKIHAYDKGIITGTGENYVISRTVEIFKQIANSNLNVLPQCLNLSRKIRELEIGTDYFQVENTKLLCSSYSEDGTQLYKIERFDPSQLYELIAIKPMSITIWMFHPNIEAISEDLQNLYVDLKDYNTFENDIDWINYYVNRLARIYQKQSLHDPYMSSSFDFLFQVKDEYIIGHIPNADSSIIEFEMIS
ncbi:hypothetical protein DCO44_14935 [Acinetobacter sp. AM]|uniref:hypothetical protein n=1 Tax=Acinetobacter sp. AM TaxID=2170730 RepID=UPI000DE66ADA|nr:hypothetical protein [Acinetobacter sp. AM]PWB13239.1 hypothetical protein DCO44_14935 [Acinetobacter sp. AM]